MVLELNNCHNVQSFRHHNDVRMSPTASQITSLPIVYSIVYLGGDQRKHQRSASLAFVRGIHRWPVNSPHKGPVTRKMLPFHDVIMVWVQRRCNFFLWCISDGLGDFLAKRYLRCNVIHENFICFENAILMLIPFGVPRCYYAMHSKCMPRQFVWTFHRMPNQDGITRDHCRHLDNHCLLLWTWFYQLSTLRASQDYVLPYTHIQWTIWSTQSTCKV